MKRFMFSLQRMLDYKDQLLEREKNELRRLNFTKNELLERIEELRRQESEIDLNLRTRAREGISIFDIKSEEFRIENIRAIIPTIMLEVKKVDRAIEKQMQAVLQASQEVKGLEKLRENQLETHTQDEIRTQREEIEEFISMKLVREAK